MSKSDAVVRARRLYNKYQTRDPFILARKLGIQFVYFQKRTNLKGMFRLVNNVPFIFLNPFLKEYMQRMVCAHELGHALLHRQICKKEGQLVEFELFDIKTSVELEANVFASELLYDEDDLIEYMENGYSLVNVAKATNTNVNLLLIKLNSMNENGNMHMSLPEMPRSGFMGRMSDGDETVY